jgi:AcrR family transcriptional regulator
LAAAKTRQKSLRYDQLLEKAAEVFAANGYAEATITQIAAELDISGPALYYYVKSKDELLYEIWKRAGAKLQHGIDEVMDAPGPTLTKLERAFHKHLEIIVKDKPIFEVLILQRSRLPEFNREKLVDDEREYVESFTRLVSEYMTEHDKTGNAKIFTLGAIAMLNSVLRWYSPADKLTLDEIADLYFGLFVNGIGAREA